jgi:hypothetical protein
MWPVSGQCAGPDASSVDESPISEILPGLYRAVLDAVANLEARDLRREAAAIRTEATRVYSHSWTADAARRLRTLRLRADRIRDSRRPRRYDAVLETLGRLADVERTTA